MTSVLAQAVQECEHGIVEQAWLVDVAHVAGIGDDDLLRTGDLGGDVVCGAEERLVASADQRVTVLDGDTGLAFQFPATSSPVVRCARSPGEDRFSFVDADGTTWLKAFDFGDVNTSYVPLDTSEPWGAPEWRGLPVDLVR